jgi:hypothetical protein
MGRNFLPEIYGSLLLYRTIPATKVLRIVVADFSSAMSAGLPLFHRGGPFF